jgi:Recombinase
MLATDLLPLDSDRSMENQQVADWLNQNSYQTKRGQQWQRISVKRVLDRLYGRTPRIMGMERSDDQDD